MSGTSGGSETSGRGEASEVALSHLSHSSRLSHTPKPAAPQSAIDREAFFALAARVFGVERREIDETTAYESIPGWDSVNHLRLVMETERAFGVRYPLERIPSMKTLRDFLA